MPPILGCIGDDFTGSTDLANTLVRQGMRVIQTCGIPAPGLALPEADALVVSLKCRSIDPDEAVAQCTEALDWLRKQGCSRFFWKYCSTFDSTPKGNIGPVAKALLEKLGASHTIACPAFPENKRSIYKGHLFVGDLPLNESPMRDHPLTPMRDSSLQRLLSPQVNEPVGLVTWETVRKGAKAVQEHLEALGAKGIRFVIPDAIEDADLFTLGEACADLPLITGGSGIALGLPGSYRKSGMLQSRADSAMPIQVRGKTAILSGSCSEATRAQLAAFSAHGLPMRQLDPLLLAKGPEHLEETLAWAKERFAGEKPVLVHAGEAPEKVGAVQEHLGRERAGALVEEALAKLSVAFVREGVRRLIVAGGETSGAVVTALAVSGLHIGPQIAPGVPWTVSIEDPALALALKSGNFGGPDFFADALDMLPWTDGGWR